MTAPAFTFLFIVFALWPRAHAVKQYLWQEGNLKSMASSRQRSRAPLWSSFTKPIFILAAELKTQSEHCRLNRNSGLQTYPWVPDIWLTNEYIWIWSHRFLLCCFDYSKTFELGIKREKKKEEMSEKAIKTKTKAIIYDLTAVMLEVDLHNLGWKCHTTVRAILCDELSHALCKARAFVRLHCQSDPFWNTYWLLFTTFSLFLHQGWKKVSSICLCLEF